MTEPFLPQSPSCKATPWIFPGDTLDMWCGLQSKISWKFSAGA